MKEDYLHAIWRLKRLPVKQLFLTDGRKLRILNTGFHNYDAGPDFFNGSIEIDGVSWNGNIEIHVKSSDWYLHKHQNDRAYDNVILHIVYQHDKEVYLNDEKIPTLELHDLIDFNHWKRYNDIVNQQSWIPCEKLFTQVNSISITNQIEAALAERIERKTKELQSLYIENRKDLFRFYFEIYARSFGLKVNNLAFIQLSKQIDKTLIFRNSAEDLQVLFLGLSGFLGTDHERWKHLSHKYGLKAMDQSIWKTKGLRPSSFPEKRIEEFARLCSNPHFFSLQDFDAGQIKEMIKGLFFSTFFEKNLIINALAPLLSWYSLHLRNEKYKELAIQLLQDTKPEDNKIIQKWKNLGIKVKSSFETQGLLELKNEICTKKKCLSCKIGHQLLKA